MPWIPIPLHIYKGSEKILLNIPNSALSTGIPFIQIRSGPMDTCGLVAELAHYIDAYGECGAPWNPIEPSAFP